MKTLSLTLACAGFLVGIVAAYFWWKASVGSLPPLPGGKGVGISMGDTHGWLEKVELSLNQSSQLNRNAALLSAVAVLLTTGSSLAGLIGQ